MAGLYLLTLHGMGETRQNYWADFHRHLRSRLESAVWDNIHFEPIYYQDVFQGNQFRVWENMPPRYMDWAYLRRFLLFGFSDAAVLERRPDEDESAYIQVQRKIREALQRCLSEVGDLNRPVVIVAQSLGCQVISNYIWDAQQDEAQGIWDHDRIEDDEVADFLKLNTLRLLMTTGCNIPIFVAGHRPIEAISKPNDRFRWFNYFDKDDVLGWPLKTLSPSYDAVVNADVPIGSGGWLQDPTPLSHNGYWTDRDFLEPLADKLSGI